MGKRLIKQIFQTVDILFVSVVGADLVLAGFADQLGSDAKLDLLLACVFWLGVDVGVGPWGHPRGLLFGVTLYLLVGYKVAEFTWDELTSFKRGFP